MLLASETALRVEEILARRVMTRRDAEAELESSVRGLLSPTAEDRADAARKLLDAGLFPRATAFAVVAVRSDPRSAPAWSTPADAESEDAGLDLARDAIAHAARARPRGSVASAVGTGETLVVVGDARGPLDLRDFAALLHRELTPESCLGQPTTVGVGGTRSRLADVGVSFDQAMIAARIAERQGHPVGVWGDDPTEVLLEVVLRSSWDDHLVPEVLTALGESEPAATLGVVETYLNKAGNVLATAEALHSHRSTVYYHLGKFQTSSGLDLDDGDTRLLLQLWFRLRGRRSSR
jgi:hypothetical protein